MKETGHKLYILIIIALISGACNQAAPEKPETPDLSHQKDDLNKASTLIEQTFDTLSHALMNAMQNHGPVYALEFCNEQALNLTQSRLPQNWSISRQSFKFRNPKNQPNVYAASALDSFAKMTFPQDRDQWIVMQTPHDLRFYKPIVLMPHCMICHGDPKSDIPKPVLAEIQKLYPQDQAVGYLPQQLRGVWEVIKHNKESQHSILN